MLTSAFPPQNLLSETSRGTFRCTRPFSPGWMYLNAINSTTSGPVLLKSASLLSRFWPLQMPPCAIPAASCLFGSRSRRDQRAKSPTLVLAFPAAAAEDSDLVGLAAVASCSAKAVLELLECCSTSAFDTPIGVPAPTAILSVAFALLDEEGEEDCEPLRGRLLAGLRSTSRA